MPEKEIGTKNEILDQLQKLPEAETPAPADAGAGLQYEYLTGAELTGLFAAHMELVVVPFKIGAYDCTASLRQMDADQMAKYRDLVARFATKEGETEGETKFYYEPDTALADLAILLGTVQDMELYWDAPVRKGSTDREKQKYPYPPPGPNRIALFKGMLPKLRALLVNECKRVNGLHPLPQAEDTSGTLT